MKTDLNYIKKLLKILETGDINEIEIEEEGTRVKVVKSRPAENNSAPQFVTYAAPPPAAAHPTSGGGTQEPQITAPQTKTEAKKEATLVAEGTIEVRSPIVGTFYRAPSPNADPYVQVGQQVTKGTILCIIEAMKLMNEIECDYEGKIVKILVENAQPVEYNQVLFLVEPN
jgi:acetyl-CoA carboxylase biotin carboxyl carrier protein